MGFTHQGRTLHKVAVIGSGQIGPDIALYFTKVLSDAGVQVVVVDVVEAALQKGRAKLERKVGKGVESGVFTPEQQATMHKQLEWTTDYQRIAGAELVVEAATENRELKTRIFAQVEGLVPASAILASNSSHLEPEVIFAGCKEKRRTGVIHYFFPAERNLVVEVVPGRETDPAITAWLLSFYEAIGKVPLQVKSRYGYALDPIFEGLFQAALGLADAGVATSKQIDAVMAKALGMTVGSFTAMNLTVGNPITAVGLDHYTSKIHSWFQTPPSLRARAQSGAPWDVPQRGEEVAVGDGLRQRITDAVRGAYFGLCGEVLDAGLISLADLELGLELALDMKPAFQLMNELGTREALRLVQAFHAANPGFPVPRCIAERGARNEPFDVPVVLRRDVGDVAVLTIRRPKVLNALNEKVFAEIQRRCQEAEQDRRIQAIVLTGFGRKAFVSGADVRFLRQIESPAHGEQTSRASQAVLNVIEDLEKPVLCALNGLAFGGGIELAMACTMRIAPKGLKVLAAQPETNLGIIPGAGGTQRLPRLIGIEPASALLRTARPISAAEARQLGLIAEEVEGDLLERAVGLARELAAGKVKPQPIRREPLVAVPSSLPAVDIGHRSRIVDEILCKAILDGARLPLRAGLELEAHCFGEVCATKDMRIGVENFLTHGPRAPAPFVHG
jgi:enoyl-CoA hydratase/3-hydroxyacyl-CoA dehydrogenase